jgi:hypothetical protein
MLVQVKNFVDVAARAREFGCRVPVGIALLPGNFSTAANAGEFCYHATTPHVRAAWRSVALYDEGPSGTGGRNPGTGLGDQGSGVSSGIRENGDCTAAHSMGCSEGLSPFSRSLVPSETGPQTPAPSASAQVPLAIFFGASFLSGPAHLVAVVLGMVASVFTCDPGAASPREVRFDVVVERPGGGCACLEYQGDAYGLVTLVEEVRGIWAGR